MNMDKLGKILIVDDNQDVLFSLNVLLEPYTEKIIVATDPEKVIPFMKMHNPDVILLDMNFRRDMVSGQEGFDLLKEILQTDPQAVVIFMTAYSDTEKAVRAIKAGATDYISKPWEKDKLLATLSSAMKLRQSLTQIVKLEEQVEVLSVKKDIIIGESDAMMDVFDTIDKLSNTDANVLILGENGTGKDLIAQRLFEKSSRRDKPFVGIDLGSIPENLFESELFGYEKGAFTGAAKAKAGRMEVASGGTLFLDEIGNLSLSMQAKLLTAIEKRSISRLGSTSYTNIDVRLICATNVNIYEMAETGKFRQDLLYRINTVEIHIPPLRERGHDIILLAEHFLNIYAKKYEKTYRGLTRDARETLLKYSWPGNVRELQHAMERAIIMNNGISMIGKSDFMLTPSKRTAAPKDETLNLEAIERQTIEKALKLSGGNMNRAAEHLGITRYTLYRKIEKLGL